MSNVVPINLNQQEAAKVMEKIVVEGDLARLSPEERLFYYQIVCESVGLNPLTRPFEYIFLNKKLVLYAKKDATDQLRKIHGISVSITSREKVGNVYVVTAKARTKDGREDEAIGAVPLTKKEVVWDEKQKKYVPTGKIVPLTDEELANAIMRAECVPLDSEILTIDGFKRYDEVKVGDLVLAYDCKTDTTIWTPLQKVSVFKNAEIAKLKSKRGNFEVLCTPDHSWAVKRSEGYKPDKRGDGSRGPRGPYANRGPERALVKANELKTHHRIILAAPEKGTINSLLTPEEAAILGWAVTDGTIKRVGNSIRIGICQSKVQNFEAIRKAVVAVAGEVKEFVTPARTRTFPSGRTYNTLEQHWWYIPSSISKSILEKAGFQSYDDLPRIVTRLSSEARKKMLEAFMLADGDKKGRFAKSKPGVIEAFQILCTLEGISIGKATTRQHVTSVKMKTARHLAVSYLQLEPAGRCDVWCPTTHYGTWVMRQNGRVMITGNTKAKRRVTLSIAGLGMLDETELDTIPEENIRHFQEDVPAATILEMKPQEKQDGQEGREKPAAPENPAQQEQPAEKTANPVSGDDSGKSDVREFTLLNVVASVSKKTGEPFMEIFVKGLKRPIYARGEGMKEAEKIKGGEGSRIVLETFEETFKEGNFIFLKRVIDGGSSPAQPETAAAETGKNDETPSISEPVAQGDEKRFVLGEFKEGKTGSDMPYVKFFATDTSTGEKIEVIAGGAGGADKVELFRTIPRNGTFGMKLKKVQGVLFLEEVIL